MAGHLRKDMAWCGERLRRVRESHELTQEEVAEACDSTRYSVGRWENGEAEPKATQLARLCGLLQVTVNHFFKRKAAA